MIENKTFSDFTGGVNYTDPELNMRENYFVKARNVELVYDSTIKKRNGFKLVKNLYSNMNAGEIINEIFYFQLHVIVVTNQGRVLTVDDQNNVEVIWDSTIATAQGKDTTIWNHPSERCFGTVGSGRLVLSNGYDKPLQVDLYPAQETESKCHYLLDPAGGSNAKVPIIYKACMVNHYMCACVIGSNNIYVSAKNQIGVWANETDVSGVESTQEGACWIDIDQIVGIPNQNIVDLSTFKNMLCVVTEYHIVLIELDVYTEASNWSEEQKTNVTVRNHTPVVNIVIENAGAATVGSLQGTMRTMVFLSVNGVNEIERNAISQNFVPTSLSEKILPFIKSKLTPEVFENGVWSMVDKQKYVYGVKFADNEMLCLSFHPNINQPCYWIWDNIRYKSFASNVYGRMLAADKYGIFIYADDSEGYCKDDYIDDSGVAQSSTFVFEVETPWLSFGKPNNVKTMDYINVITDGTSTFNVRAACDMVSDWQLDLEMVGGSMPGYGSGQNPYYGGNLITGTEQLCEFPQVFMYAKFGFRSEDEKPLRIIRYGSFYKTGGIRR